MSNREAQQCIGKTRYADELAAKIALGKLGRTGRLKPTDTMRIYRCEFCGFWHMGHGVGGRPWYEIWR
jgi:hypothetical protein